MVTFDADTYWKGDARSRITVGQIGTVDGVELVAGQRYVVFTYASKPNESLNNEILPAELINPCASTTYAEAGRTGLLRQLGRGRSPR